VHGSRNLALARLAAFAAFALASSTGAAARIGERCGGLDGAARRA
jgi:hypothetical protein